MDYKTCLVITSIHSSANKVLQEYARLCPKNDTHFILAGDLKTPKGFQLQGCEYLDIETQKELPFTIAKKIPDNCYAKKNIGYLQAMRSGYNIIQETDDDNIPFNSFWKAKKLEVNGREAKTNTWLNVYSLFTKEVIWPRGFLLNRVYEEAGSYNSSQTTHICPVQQSLVNENPDVDAIYRLTHKLPFNFADNDAIILGTNTICPFNSQNTTWFKEAFPLMYLPSYCSFRMTDIWRSFIAQRILWTCGWHISFHSPTAKQERNAHDLMKDFEQEIPGYLHNEVIMKKLIQLELPHGKNYILDNLKTCYEMMVKEGYVDIREIALVDAWINDLRTFL